MRHTSLHSNFACEAIENRQFLSVSVQVDPGTEVVVQTTATPSLTANANASNSATVNTGATTATTTSAASPTSFNVNTFMGPLATRDPAAFSETGLLVDPNLLVGPGF